MCKLVYPLVAIVMCGGCVVEDALEQAMATAILANFQTILEAIIAAATTTGGVA